MQWFGLENKKIKYLMYHNTLGKPLQWLPDMVDMAAVPEPTGAMKSNWDTGTALNGRWASYVELGLVRTHTHTCTILFTTKWTPLQQSNPAKLHLDTGSWLYQLVVNRQASQKSMCVFWTCRKKANKKSVSEKKKKRLDIFQKRARERLSATLTFPATVPV